MNAFRAASSVLAIVGGLCCTLVLLPARRRPSWIDVYQTRVLAAGGALLAGAFVCWLRS